MSEQITFTVLGSGGWYPSVARETCSALLRQGDRAILIDAGTGVSNLARWDHLLDGVKSWTLLLTHFHLDHVTGIEWVKDFPVPLPAIQAPGGWLLGRRSEEILEDLTTFLPTGIRAADLGAGIDELGPGLNRNEGFDLLLRAQPRHSDPTVALRLGYQLAYCTDTAFDPENIEFVRGVSFLFHEGGTETDGHSAHSSGREVAEIARRGSVGRAYMIHHAPGSQESRILSDARAGFPETYWGWDGLTLEI